MWLIRRLILPVQMLLLLLFNSENMAFAEYYEESTLMIGVSRDGRIDSYITKSMIKLLHHMGEELIVYRHPKPAGQLCLSAECFDRLASYSNARLLIAVIIQTNNPKEYYVTSILYDVARHIPYQRTSSCSPDTLLDQLSSMVEKLFRQYRERETSQLQARKE